MIYITKADGAREPFKAHKLKTSLKRAGADTNEVAEILTQIEAELVDGMKTEVIYRRAFELLRSSTKVSAARYSLRRALFGLGPTGFPFEDFLSRLYQTMGYQTKTRIILEGKCARHELDVAAYTEKHSFVAEAKFHARPGIKSDLQVAMYSYARFLDLQNQKVCNKDVCGIKEFHIVTNTKFTSAATKYAECVGVHLLSWDYPKQGNLHDLISKAHIYPVTVLASLSQKDKRTLIQAGAILCKDILETPHTLRRLHLSKRKFEAVLSEARQLCERE